MIKACICVLFVGMFIIKQRQNHTMTLSYMYGCDDECGWASSKHRNTRSEQHAILFIVLFILCFGFVSTMLYSIKCPPSTHFVCCICSQLAFVFASLFTYSCQQSVVLEWNSFQASDLHNNAHHIPLLTFLNSVRMY